MTNSVTTEVEDKFYSVANKFLLPLSERQLPSSPWPVYSDTFTRLEGLGSPGHNEIARKLSCSVLRLVHKRAGTL